MVIHEDHHHNEWRHGDPERQPLLHNHRPALADEAADSRQSIQFDQGDAENPRNWAYGKKMLNVATIAAMSLLSPLASSMFTPGIQQIADGLDTSTNAVIGCTTGFVIMLGVGPLIVAPLSETFGRRPMYLICFSVFTLLQIPSALSPNIATLITMRTLAGFFGSVSIANGGGSLGDMFEPGQRAGIFGWYLLGPLLGPTLGPITGGVIVNRLHWRWIFWFLTVFCAITTAVGYFVLKESYAPVILAKRQRSLEKQHGPSKYTYDGEDSRPFHVKLRHSLTRPLRILVQPIVFTMSVYQAILYSTTFSIYTNMQPIYGGQYKFNSEQVGLMYLGPGFGFLCCVWFIVPRIDTVYNYLASRTKDGQGCPEFRLPLANIGSVFIPIALFWFAWAVERNEPWYVSIMATFFYGIGQIVILNTTTNYYIDCFERYAASAIAAGAVFRSIFGGIVPLFAPSIFKALGYGWGISVFGFLSLLIAPAPLTFYFYGAWVRKRFQINL